MKQFIDNLKIYLFQLRIWLDKLKTFSVPMDMSNIGHYIVLGQGLYAVVAFVTGPIVGMVAVVIAAIAKELFDKYIKGTEISVADLLYGIAGGATLYLT